MSSSREADEIIGLETVSDVTERTKQILVLMNDGQEHPLIEYDGTQRRENIISDFRRGAVRIVNGIEYSGRLFPKKDPSWDSDMEESAHKVEQSTLDSYLSQFQNMGIDLNNISKYNSQAFSGIANRVLLPALGNNAGRYKPSFYNGLVCHLWDEEVQGEKHLCILSIHEGLEVTINIDEATRYIPGAMAIELKVPFSVIKDKSPITEKYITKVLVTSEELHNLLSISFDEKLKDLISNASSEPVLNFGVKKVIQSGFKYALFNADRIEPLIELLSDEDLRGDSDVDSLTVSCSDLSDDSNLASSNGSGSDLSEGSGSDKEEGSVSEEEKKKPMVVIESPAFKISALLANLTDDFNAEISSPKCKIKEIAQRYVEKYKEGSAKKSPEEFLVFLSRNRLDQNPKSESGIFSNVISFFSRSKEVQFYELFGSFMNNTAKQNALIAFLEENQMSEKLADVMGSRPK